MLSYRRYKIWFFLLIGCFFAAAWFLLPRIGADAAETRAVASVDDTEYDDFSIALANWDQGKTLKLLSDRTVSQTIEIRDEVTLDLNGHVLESKASRVIRVESKGALTLRDSSSAETGRLGNGIWVSGRLRMTGGKISGCSAELGGGIYIESGAETTVTGGEISGNSAEQSGGGIYVCGTLRVGGTARITGNTDRNKKANNIVLAGGKISIEDGFSGLIGVTAALGDRFAEGCTNSEGVFSDDLTYSVRADEKSLEMRLSPLKSAEAKFDSEEKIFPTTPTQSLLKYLKFTYRNENGVAYPSGNVSGHTVLTQTLQAGENEITVEMFGTEGERIETSFTVNAVAPALLRAELEFRQSGVYHFDTDPESGKKEVAEDLTVTGIYEDTLSRRLFSSGEETAENCGESYIVDYFSVSGDKR